MVQRQLSENDPHRVRFVFENINVDVSYILVDIVQLIYNSLENAYVLMNNSILRSLLLVIIVANVMIGSNFFSGKRSS